MTRSPEEKLLSSFSCQILDDLQVPRKACYRQACKTIRICGVEEHVTSCLQQLPYQLEASKLARRVEARAVISLTDSPEHHLFGNPCSCRLCNDLISIISFGM